MSALEMIKRAVAAGASQEVIDNLAKAGAYAVRIKDRSTRGLCLCEDCLDIHNPNV
jgi:hypothetical protein